MWVLWLGTGWGCACVARVYTRGCTHIPTAAFFRSSLSSLQSTRLVPAETAMYGSAASCVLAHSATSSAV
jgi:hypothetical protein